MQFVGSYAHPPYLHVSVSTLKLADLLVLLLPIDPPDKSWNNTKADWQASQYQSWRSGETSALTDDAALGRDDNDVGVSGECVEIDPGKRIIVSIYFYTEVE
jgi:hypothetical protein